MEDETSSPLNGTGSRTSAPAIEKAAKIIDVVSRTPTGIGISEISRTAEISKSTVHALVNALVDVGYLVPVNGTKTVGLGPALAHLGTRARDFLLLDIAESSLARLALRTGETALFGRLSGDRVLILARRESSRVLKLSAPVGSSVPVFAGALGKVYLASLDPQDAERVYRSEQGTTWGQGILDREGAYALDVALARKTGYARDVGEHLQGISAVASIFHWLRSTYFVWIVGITATYHDAELDLLGEAVADTVRDIYERLRSSNRSDDT